MNRRTRRLAGGAAALGAGALLIAPLVAGAQSDDDGSTTTTTTPATTDESTADESTTDESTTSDMPPDRSGEMASHLTEILQPLVDDGTITQAQLDAVIQTLEDAGPRFGGEGRGPGGWPGGPGGGPGGHHGGFGGRLSLDAAAGAIGISEDDLRAAIEDGQTMAEVATANGVEPQAVIDALVAEARTRLDEAVVDGRLDQAAADERLADVTERITTAVNEGFPAKGDGPGRWGRERGDDDADDTEGTEAPATTEGGS